jgi:S1-C subfamily serine protease
MAEPGDKIVIRPEDLAVVPPRVAESGVRPTSPPPPGAVVPPIEPPSAAAWREEARRRTKQRNLLIAALSALGAVLVMCLGGGIIYSLLPQPDWLQQAARAAEYGVVRIESGRSLGTGFVIASRGQQHLILTNKHVLASGPGCRVVLRSGEAVPGDVVGYAADDDIDLALVRVNVDSPALRPLGRIGSFDAVQSGQRVVAIGHPLGLDYSITEGIVSAKRSNLLVQTSAAIHPGNSGGPLINEDGEIIGVNTFQLDPQAGQSVGFAFRADLVQDRSLWNFREDISDLLRAVR